MSELDGYDSQEQRLREARQLIACAIPIVAEHSAFLGSEPLDEVMMRWLEQGSGAESERRTEVQDA